MASGNRHECIREPCEDHKIFNGIDVGLYITNGPCCTWRWIGQGFNQGGEERVLEIVSWQRFDCFCDKRWRQSIKSRFQHIDARTDVDKCDLRSRVESNRDKL